MFHNVLKPKFFYPTPFFVFPLGRLYFKVRLSTSTVFKILLVILPYFAWINIDSPFCSAQVKFGHQQARQSSQKNNQGQNIVYRY